MDARRTTIMAFRANEAARLTGLTRWQIDNWRDLVKPSWDSGAYSFQDLVLLRTLAQLHETYNIPTRSLRRVVHFIQTRTNDTLSGVKIGVGPNNKLAFFLKKDGVWELADGTGQTIAEVTLDHVMERLRRDVKTYRTRPRSKWGTTERTVGVCGNRERFAGTRVAVELVVDMVKAGASNRALREEFPTLQAPDIALAKKLAAAG